VTFVTGTSCAGKTHLKAELDERGYYELDAIDLDADAPCRPQTAWLDWLRWRAAELLRSATEHEGRDWLVVTGIVWPLSLVDSPAWAPARRAGVEVEFFLLHPPWKLVHARLADRAPGSRRELAELRRYNRRLRNQLLEQTLAVRGGEVVRAADLEDQLELLFDRTRWTEWRPS
jgi:hypothetical protein